MTALTIALLTMTGCKKVEPAPEDLDSLMQWFWENYEADDPAVLVEAVDNLHLEIGGDTFEDLEDGSLTSLSAEAADGLPISPAPDVAEARGFYLLNTFPCTLKTLESILYDLDQGSMYDDAYVTYRRSYLTDLDAYLDRQEDSLGWEVELTGDLLGADFTEWLQGGLRYLPDTGQGPALMARTFMTKPSAFEEGSNKVFDQDYQIEVFYERSPGEIMHAYGLWRTMDMGGGITMEDDAAVRIILNNLADWDDRTAELCEAGAP